jgi:hypothetical protein
VGPGQVGPLELGAAEQRLLQVGPGQLGVLEAGPAQVDPAQVGPGQPGPAEPGLGQQRPGQVQRRVAGEHGPPGQGGHGRVHVRLPNLKGSGGALGPHRRPV